MDNTDTRRPTSHEVAAAAGVSQTTVSRVFNPKWTNRIKQETREKVLAAADQLGYTPNALASGLISRRTNIVAYVMTNEFNLFYSDLLIRITNLFLQHGIQVMVYSVAPDNDINRIFRKLEGYSVDGAIISSSSLTERFSSRLSDNRIPYVVMNANSGDLDCNSVYSDSYEGCRKAANYLYQLGHRRFAFLSNGDSPYNTNLRREQGFLDGLRENGIEDCLILPGDFTYESGAKAALDLYSVNGSKPDAVFCINDLMAMGFIDAVRYDLGIRVPEDVSVIGFDDNLIARFKTYELTTVRQNMDALARETVKMMLAIIEDPSAASQKVKIPTELVVRGTVRKLG